MIFLSWTNISFVRRKRHGSFFLTWYPARWNATSFGFFDTHLLVQHRLAQSPENEVKLKTGAQLQKNESYVDKVPLEVGL